MYAGLAIRDVPYVPTIFNCSLPTSTNDGPKCCAAQNGTYVPSSNALAFESHCIGPVLPQTLAACVPEGVGCRVLKAGTNVPAPYNGAPVVSTAGTWLSAFVCSLTLAHALLAL